jgi:hypothetical protein
MNTVSILKKIFTPVFILLTLIIFTSFQNIQGKERHRFHQGKRGYKFNVSVVSVFQNEGPYLKEWIDYHRLIGVDHFYLYNHHSNDNFFEVLQPYITAGIVEYFEFSVPNFPQNEAIEDALSRAKGKTKWLASIDTDEFILPKKHSNLGEFLKEYEEFAGVTLNWQCFGTSHIPSIPPEELLLEHLTFKAESQFSWNSHVKPIVRPEKVSGVVNPHCFTYHAPYYAVRPDKTLQHHSHESPIQTELIVLNHYWTRDEYFFHNIKIPRCERIKNWSKEFTLEISAQMNVIEDRFLLDKYVQNLKEFMKQKL